MSAPSDLDHLPEHVQREIIAVRNAPYAPRKGPSEMEIELKYMYSLEPRKTSMGRTGPRAPRKPKPKTPLTEITLDLETEMDWQQAKQLSDQPALQLAAFANAPWIAVTGQQDGSTLTWSKFELLDLVKYLQNRIVTGWNINAFDLPIIALSAFRARQTQWNAPIQSIDLFELIRRDTQVMFRLENVAQLNLEQGKLGNSAAIPALFKTLPAGEKWDQLEAYQQIVAHCQRDVLLERQLLDKARSEGLRLPAVAASKYLLDGLPESKWAFPPTPEGP